jgi:hypothetical protein
MGKPHPIELRTRVVAFVAESHGHREAARHFRVSPKFVNELIKLRCETGSLLPRLQGNGGSNGTPLCECRVMFVDKLKIVERQPLCPRATTILAGFQAAEVGVLFGFSG